MGVARFAEAMKQRIITTIVLWSLLGLILGLTGWIGGLVLLLAVTALTQLETRRMGLTAGGVDPQPRSSLPELILGAAVLLGAFLVAEVEFALILGIVLGLIALAPPATCEAARRELTGIAARTFYLPWMLQFYVLALHHFDTLWVPVWLIAVAKFNDVGALLVGRQFGKHKMAQAISPGKTWEGALGGVFVGGVVGSGLSLVPAFQAATGLTPGLAFEVALLLGPVAVASDLTGSWLKRRAGVKDSGSTLPGIGGLLDLIDSLLLVAPVGYGMLLLAGRVWAS